MEVGMLPSASTLGLLDGADPDTIIKPIIVGTVAEQLPPEQQTEEKTHRWTVYVRGVNNEDLSYFISHVVFKLHWSFAEPDRSRLKRRGLGELICV
jgi:transcription initiation factor IIF auxiliary subunit